MMDDKTQQLIASLAEKLGTTAEHLWGVMIQQAPISAGIDFVITGLIVAGTIIGWAYWRRMYRAFMEGGCQENEVSVFLGFLTVVCTVASFLAVLVTIFAISNITTALLNPEYWVLREVLKAVK